ncbi:efflux RND transporter periplasmic adaptor subunit [Urbifossiella limnaea]|uniref:Macrolide export protein MacA n=1 Tax=Urbifossiella limnaea TaxID=2528023 RepID=A0A517XW84_9BACT|nr:efflux RND transporter periplasmic adaptor subunit [Urbifossiella limnaea]QDU21765.1 Macrolide export protein MacA [Urbifossiella limnaea]
MATDTGKTTTRRYLWLGGKVALALVATGVVVYRLWFVPVSVQRHTVESGEIVVEVMGTGTLDAHVKAAVSTKIPGRLKTVLVDQGDTVKEGQEVARLDDLDLGHEVEVEEANVAARKAAVDRLQAEVTQTKVVLTQATSNEDRVRRVLASGGGSQDDLDKAVESLGVARANLARTEAALVEGKRQIVTAEKTLGFRRSRFEDAVIRAPFDAVVVRRDRNVGDVVVPGSSILAVVATNELWVSAWVDESAMAAVRPIQPARVVFRSHPDQPLPGTVVRTGRETDRETREFLVDVAPAKLPEDWSIGQRAEVYIETARKRAAAVIPPDYLVWRDRRPLVFVESRGRAERRAVTVGLRGRDAVEVLDGVAAGETVVAPARAGTELTDGQRVHNP